jgi:1-acyl-sn-glycerol-3-phosphate acyltransferase
MFGVIRRGIGRAVLGAAGWRLDGERRMPARFVFIAAPHTSNWDFVLMMATAFALGVRIRWLGKHTLFRGPLGWLLTRLGGIPVDRRTPARLVDALVERFRGADELRLAIPPEGTRHRVERWRSGFYHIALAAGVPIGLGFLDYATRRAGVGLFVQPTGDVGADMDRIRAFYCDIRGRRPDWQCEPRLREEDVG